MRQHTMDDYAAASRRLEREAESSRISIVDDHEDLSWFHSYECRVFFQGVAAGIMGCAIVALILYKLA